MLKKYFFLLVLHRRFDGLVAEWLCRGLQILGCRFDSDPSLQNKSGVGRFFSYENLAFVLEKNG